MASHDDELGALRASCTRFLHGHGLQDAAQQLSVGDATCALEPAEIRAIFAELAGAGENRRA
jgi:hypothetical protein